MTFAEAKDLVAQKSGYKDFQHMYETYIKVHGYIYTISMMNWVNEAAELAIASARKGAQGAEFRFEWFEKGYKEATKDCINDVSRGPVKAYQQAIKK